MNCIFLRRGYGTSGDGVNYVEYIESSGTQYIDTGFKPNQDTRVVMEVIHNSTAIEYLFSAATSSPVFGVSYVSGYYNEYGSKSHKFSTASPSGTKTTIDLNKNVCTIGGETVTAPTETFSCAGTIYLFCAYGGSYRAKYKLYSCKIYDNGTLVRDFRPALDLDGVACLYEKLSKTYYYNKGTGEFTAGSSVSGGGSSGGTTPTGYTITLSGSIDSSYGYATINGVKYTSAQAVTIEAGTSISVYVSGVDTSTLSFVKLNGTQVKTGNGTYTFVPSGNTTIAFAKIASVYTYHTCTITTT